MPTFNQFVKTGLTAFVFMVVLHQGSKALGVNQQVMGLLR